MGLCLVCWGRAGIRLSSPFPFPFRRAGGTVNADSKRRGCFPGHPGSCEGWPGGFWLLANISGPLEIYLVGKAQIYPESRCPTEKRLFKIHFVFLPPQDSPGFAAGGNISSKKQENVLPLSNQLLLHIKLVIKSKNQGNDFPFSHVVICPANVRVVTLEARNLNFVHLFSTSKTHFVTNHGNKRWNQLLNINKRKHS